jgi:hypothetical protein
MDPALWAARSIAQSYKENTMSRPPFESPADLPTPIMTDIEDVPEVLEDGLVPPAGISDDPEFERVVNIPD